MFFYNTFYFLYLYEIGIGIQKIISAHTICANHFSFALLNINDFALIVSYRRSEVKPLPAQQDQVTALQTAA